MTLLTPKLASSPASMDQGEGPAHVTLFGLEDGSLSTVFSTNN